MRQGTLSNSSHRAGPAETTEMLADFDQLAAGVFVAPAPGDRTHRSGGPTGADVLGVRFAGPETFQAWRQVPVAELWQWLALMTFLDPSSIPLEATLARQVRARSAVRLFQNRVALLSSLERAAGGGHSPTSESPGRSLVALGEFTEWAQRIGLPLPAEFPRATGQKKGRRAAVDSEFIRQSDLIPAMLPFSAATLWRKVKAGEFPAPVKLSTSVTAWRREEVEAWLVARSVPVRKARRASK